MLLEVMGGIGSFRPTLDRVASDVRIYCDNDPYGEGKRWTLVPDIDRDAHPNSQRTFGVDQEWEDVLNAVGRTTISRGCQSPAIQGETYNILRNPQGTVQNQNSKRAVITVRNLKEKHSSLILICYQAL